MPSHGDGVLPRLHARRVGAGRLAAVFETDAHPRLAAPEPPLGVPVPSVGWLRRTYRMRIMPFGSGNR